MARPLNLQRGVVLIGVVGSVLLLAAPWATRRALRAEMLDEVQATKALTFERPAHLAGRASPSVVGCLETAFGADAGLERPPFSLSVLMRDGGSIDGHGAVWLEAHRDGVSVIRRCLDAPRAGSVNLFPDCVARRSLDRLLLFRAGAVWLEAEARQHVDGGAPVEACLDEAALLRDGPVFGGLIGALLSAASASSSLEPCARALAAASPTERSRARASLEQVVAGLVPMSTVVRVERAATAIGLGNVMGLGDGDGLPLDERACVGGFVQDDLAVKAAVWWSAPHAWRRLEQLEALSRSDPLLATPAAREVVEDQTWSEQGLGLHGLLDWPKYARRYSNVARTTQALLAVVDVLEGRPHLKAPWLDVAKTDLGVQLMVELDDGWRSFDLRADHR